MNKKQGCISFFWLIIFFVIIYIGLVYFKPDVFNGNGINNVLNSIIK
jgi:hypothetical protein